MAACCVTSTTARPSVCPSIATSTGKTLSMKASAYRSSAFTFQGESTGDGGGGGLKGSGGRMRLKDGGDEDCLTSTVRA